MDYGFKKNYKVSRELKINYSFSIKKKDSHVLQIIQVIAPAKKKKKNTRHC